MPDYDYIRSGDAIYERSFAIIRSEADLSRFSPEEADVAVRMIHACGLVEAAQNFVFSPDFVHARAGSGQFGTDACEHLGRYVVSHQRALGKTVEQFLRQVPRPYTQFQDA